MKLLLLILLMLLTTIALSEAGCPACGGLASGVQANDVGPSLSISMGSAQYGQSAGELTIDGSAPDVNLYTPASLKYDASSRPDVSVFITNVVGAILITNIGPEALITTNLYIATNTLGGITFFLTNLVYSLDVISVTNTTAVYSTNIYLRQVFAPQALADIPAPPTPNGYVVNFYSPTNVVGTNLDGTYQVSGTPFATWLITNLDATGFNRIQISETTPADGLLKNWTYTYSTNTSSWTMGTLAGVQQNTSITNLDSSTYQVVNNLQYSNAPIAQQTKTTYQNFYWGVAPIQVDVGEPGSQKTTTYTYYDPSTFNAGTMTLKQTVVNPDGSQIYYAGYDTNGNPTAVYYTYEDDVNNREIVYVYDAATAGLSGSGDDGTINPTVARQQTEYVRGNEVSRQYTVFPSVGVRLNIQCTTPGAAWDDANNLVTTNLYYTSGTNQFALQSVISPDGTMSVYDYYAGAARTNITVTGQPDSSYSHIVDGVSNRVIVNQWGNMISSTSWDVKSGALLAQDTYGNYDNFGRAQRVTHIDGTSETNVYACCGLNYNIDRDGITTVYLYDADKREYGYQKYYEGTNSITYQMVLDAAGRSLKNFRIGTDASTITQNQSAYDTAGRLVAQTNALNGATTYVETTNGTTGGLIRTATYPDGSTRIDAYYADGSLKSVTGTAVHPVRYEYGAETDANGHACTYTEEIKLNTDGSDSSEATKTYTDMAGRTTEILYTDGHYSQSFYNSKGQLSKQVDPDGVATLYQYNGKGELAFTAADLNQDGNIDFSGFDHIMQVTNDVTTDHSTTVRRNRRYVWLDGQSTGTLVSSSETSADGLDTWQTQYRDASTPVTTHSRMVPGIARSITNTAPDGSYVVSLYSYGRLACKTQYDSAGSQLGGTLYGYDAHGRQSSMTDARNGTTTIGFNNADLVTTNTTPNPGGGSPEITITTYNNMMQATGVTQSDGTTIYTAYLLTGELGLQYGSRTYPVGYSYDYAGRMQTMTNWSNFGGGVGARVTTWNYDSQRGWLTSKVYDDGNGPSYSYTAAGRLASRTWVRGVTTSYAYDTAGSLTNITYSDATPAVASSYDRLGRLASAISDGMTDTLAYNLANELLGESFSGGILSGLAVSNNYDAYLRRTMLSALASGSQLTATAYGYDSASRLSTVSDGTNNATYSYLANSPLVSQIVFKQNSATRMTTTKSYDYLNRLTQISSAPSSGLVSTFNYNYNAANQRIHNTLADGSYWIYGYDSLGQVTNACKYFADGTLVAGQEFAYTFDTIGNRTQSKVGGDSTGANMRTANYTNNTLNQITSRDVPPYVDVMGASILTNTVTINGNMAYRKEEYYRQQLPANNNASALWTNVIVTGGQSVTGNVYVAQTPEHFSYDPDGNLTNDGRWAYTWDGENRLIGMTVNTNVGPQYQLTFAYDAKGRRIQKLVATNGVALSTNNFLYDGWNLIAEMRPDNSLIRSYVWGTDLSGTSQGAGGVGGLLEMSYYGTSTTNCFPAYDGNGNIMALVNAADGAVAANYDYAAFGEPIRITGVMVRNNPFRFSTKYADDESDLLYYGYRYYKPSTGTWPNKDLIGELGFENIRRNQPLKLIGGSNRYMFVNNNAVKFADPFGLKKIDDTDYKSIADAAKEMYEQYKKSKCFVCMQMDSITRTTCECITDNKGDLKKMAHCLCYTVYVGQDTAQCEKDLNDSKW